MALGNYALVTVANAQIYLRRTGITADEALLEILIDAYSKAIQRYCDRQFAPTETAVAKKFRYDGTGYLSLAPYELSAVTSVVLYTDLAEASWDTLTAQTVTAEAEYRLEPRNGTSESTYLWIALPELGVFSESGGQQAEPLLRRRRGRQVTITGNWGTASVPADVQLACLMSVSDGFRNPEGFGARNIGALSVVEVPDVPEQTGRSIPPDARAMLGSYRRIAYGR